MRSLAACPPLGAPAHASRHAGRSRAAGVTGKLAGKEQTETWTMSLDTPDGHCPVQSKSGATINPEAAPRFHSCAGLILPAMEGGARPA